MVQETVFDLVYIVDGTVKLYRARLRGWGGYRRGGCLILALPVGKRE